MQICTYTEVNREREREHCGWLVDIYLYCPPQFSMLFCFALYIIKLLQTSSLAQDSYQ